MHKFTKEVSVCTFEKKRQRATAQKSVAIFGALGLAVVSLGGCVTVRPEQRAILADPVMQFQGDPREAAQRQHVLDNREGSFGGSSVQGGGCGCN
jgi:hypothetical protein